MMRYTGKPEEHIGTGKPGGSAHDRRKARRKGFALKSSPENIIPTNAEKLVFATPEEAEEYRKAAGLPASWRAEETSAPEEN